jgi:hypothetical protein
MTGRFWVIRHQDQSQPKVVAKFDTAGTTQIPDDVANHDTFSVLELSSRSALADQSIDHSVLSSSEKELLSQVYPVLS